MRFFIATFLFFTISLYSSYLKQFNCSDLYIFSDTKDIADKLNAKNIPEISLDVKLKSYAYNPLDNLIYAMVVDPISLKGWSRYDIVKIDKYGKVFNLGTPLFKNGDNVYDAFRVGNGVIDSYGYYYSLGDPISIDPEHLKRAILYIVYLGNNPKAGSLRFDKKSLKLLNFYEWKAPNSIAYLDLNQKIYAVNDKHIFEIDIKKLTIKELDIKNPIKSDIKNIWTKNNQIFIYSLDGYIYKVKIKRDEVIFEKFKEVGKLSSFELTTCTAPILRVNSSRESVELGDSFFYNIEIENPFSYPIKVEFVDQIGDGASFEKLDSINLKSSNFYFSSDEVRLEDILIPELSTLKFKLKVNIENNINYNIFNSTYIIFRGIKIFPKNTKASNVVLDTPSIELKERLLKNKDLDGSGDISVGDRLIFEVEAINIGKVNLYDVKVGDPTLTPDSTFCQLLKPKERCSFKGVYRVKLSDERRQKILTYANVSARNVPKKYFTLSTPVAVDAVDLSIKIKKETTQNYNLIIKNISNEMATDIKVELFASKEVQIRPKNSWNIPFIDGNSTYQIPFKVKFLKNKKYILIAKVSSEDRDLNLSNNEVKLNIDMSNKIFKKDINISTSKLKIEKMVTEKISNISKNSSPIAKDDEIIVPMNQTTIVDISQGVLVNDKDLDGDALKVISFKVDSNGDGVDEIYHPKDLVDIYGVGYFTMFDDGSFKLELENGYNGYIPTITYTVSDCKGGTSSADLILSIGDKFSVKRESKVEPISLDQDVEIKDGGAEYYYLFISFIFLFLRRFFAAK